MTNSSVSIFFVTALLFLRAEAGDISPQILKGPESAFEIIESGDFGRYGSELRADSVFPLNCIAKLHPLAKDKTIIRITRTGGWSRDSFLIVPQQRKRAYLVYWTTKSWNQELNVSEAKIRTKWIQDSDDFDRILSSPLVATPRTLNGLQKGPAGDDSPFLLVERLAEGRYEGALVSPILYNSKVNADAELILDGLEKQFTKPTTK